MCVYIYPELNTYLQSRLIVAGYVRWSCRGVTQGGRWNYKTSPLFPLGLHEIYRCFIKVDRSYLNEIQYK